MNIIIIGGGKTGSYIASLLLKDNHDVHIIEHRAMVQKKLLAEFPQKMVTYGNGSDPNCLESADINNADCLVAVTGEDEVNLAVATLAKFEYGVGRVVARINNPKNKWLYTPVMGVDYAINQSDIIAHCVVDEMSLKNVFTLLKLTDYSIISISVPSHSGAVGKKVFELSIPADSVLISIERDNRTIIPKGDTEIQSSDKIIALCNESIQEDLRLIFN